MAGTWRTRIRPWGGRHPGNVSSEHNVKPLYNRTTTKTDTCSTVYWATRVGYVGGGVGDSVGAGVGDGDGGYVVEGVGHSLGVVVCDGVGGYVGGGVGDSVGVGAGAGVGGYVGGGESGTLWALTSETASVDTSTME